MGIIQGGDPLSKDPAQQAKYGTGGLGVLRFEPNAEKHTRGAVSAVLVPGQRDSAGSQFFICITDQAALDGQYTIFARVVEGIGVAQKISLVAANAENVPAERIEITRATIRDKPAPEREPFVDATVDELAKQRVVIETSMGNMTVELFPDRAPTHVRAFLRMAAAGVYDGTAFHRVARGFVIQGGYLPSRRNRSSRGSRPTCGRCRRSSIQRRTIAASSRWRGGDDPGERDVLLLHRPGAHAGAGQPVHGVRASRGRTGRDRQDRSGRRERRDARRRAST